MKSKSNVTLPATIAGLSPLELARKISPAEAASLNGIHADTFRKRYPHLLKRIGKRRQGVTVYDAIMLPPPDTG